MVRGGEAGRRHRPSWATFPEVEKERWVNDLVQAMWPYLKEGFKKKKKKNTREGFFF